MVYSVMLHKANQVQSQMLNVPQKYKLVKILISSHPFNKIYLQAKKKKKIAVRCFSAILDKQWFMQLYSQAKTDIITAAETWDNNVNVYFFIGCTVIHPVSLPRSC